MRLDKAEFSIHGTKKLMLVTSSLSPTSVTNIDIVCSGVFEFFSLRTYTDKYLDFQGDNMLIFQSFRLGDSYHSKPLKILSVTHLYFQLILKFRLKSAAIPFNVFVNSCPQLRKRLKIIPTQSGIFKLLVFNLDQKFPTYGITKEDIMEMIPREYLEYIPDTKGELFDGKHMFSMQIQYLRY